MASNFMTAGNTVKLAFVLEAGNQIIYFDADNDSSCKPMWLTQDVRGAVADTTCCFKHGPGTCVTPCCTTDFVL